jgi:fucose permease
MESAVGNWMSTFAIRAASWSFSGSSLAVSVFWAALLLGRLLTPAMLAILPERRLYRASVVATIAGISLLLAAHDPRTVLAGSVLTGLALAPMFPLIISLLMAEMGESRNAGWVFATAGLGGAVLSWLTGTVSTDTGSLRIGLLVPAGAALLMMALITWRRSNPATGRTQEPILQPTLTEKV